MNRRRAAITALSLSLGVVIILSVPYRVWQATIGSPNYWEGHTGGLTSLVLEAAFGGALVVTGFAFGFDPLARRLQLRGVQISGMMAVVGGLLATPPLARMVVEAFGGGRGIQFGIRAGEFVLLVIGVAGVLAHYLPSEHRGRYGAGVLAGGLSLLAGADMLRWGLLIADPQPHTGALSFPPFGVTLAGTLALAAGSVLFGASLRNCDDAPQWLGPLLIAAGLISLPLGALVFIQYEEAIGLYGIAWLAVGGHLAIDSTRTASRFD